MIEMKTKLRWWWWWWMNELTRKSAYILRLLPIVFLLITSNDKQNMLPYVVFLWITHRCDNCIRHKSMATQFFFLRIYNCFLFENNALFARCVHAFSGGRVLYYSLSNVLSKKTKKPVFEIIIKKVEWKKRALWAAAATAARQIQHVLA